MAVVSLVLHVSLRLGLVVAVVSIGSFATWEVVSFFPVLGVWSVLVSFLRFGLLSDRGFRIVFSSFGAWRWPAR